MAGVLLIRELDFLREGEESPGRCSLLRGGILSVCYLRENLENQKKKS